jgi:phytanoyl-CoA hydroxylase
MTESELATIRFHLRHAGFAVANGVFDSGELAQLDQATRSMILTWQETNDPDFWSFTAKADSRPILYRIHRFERKAGSAVGAILNNPNFRQLIDAVFGCAATPSACALIVKESRRGAAVPWHRDPVPVPPACVYNFSVFLDEATEDNGCLEVIPGSHLTQDLVPAMLQGLPSPAIYVPARPGDVLVHDVCIIHGSAASKSDAWRRSLVTEFRPFWLGLLPAAAMTGLSPASYQPDELHRV